MKNLTFPIGIRTFLPHREPMLMVDNVLDLSEKTIQTNFKILANNIFIENNQLSEVGIIENAAQTCSGIVGWPHFEANKSDKDYAISGYISRIKQVEIFDLPKIGDVLLTKGNLLNVHAIGNMYNCDMECSTYNKDKLIAKSALTLILHP